MPQIIVSPENVTEVAEGVRTGRIRVKAAHLVTKGDEMPRRQLDMRSPQALADSMALALFDAAVHGIALSVEA